MSENRRGGGLTHTVEIVMGRHTEKPNRYDRDIWKCQHHTGVGTWNAENTKYQ